MLAKITRGNQVTIPKEIVLMAHLKETSLYVDVGYTHGVIYMKPVVLEDRISPEQLEKFEKWALGNDKNDLEFKAPDDAIQHLKKRVKKI